MGSRCVVHMPRPASAGPARALPTIPRRPASVSLVCEVVRFLWAAAPVWRAVARTRDTKDAR